jgi:hypothetical protein
MKQPDGLSASKQHGIRPDRTTHDRSTRQGRASLVRGARQTYRAGHSEVKTSIYGQRAPNLCNPSAETDLVAPEPSLNFVGQSTSTTGFVEFHSDSAERDAMVKVPGRREISVDHGIRNLSLSLAPA